MRLKNQKGSVLITLIIAMVLMAFLSLGIYSLFTSSTFSELLSNRNDNAYQLAKAGIRYAVDRCSADPNCFPANVDYLMPDSSNKFNIAKNGDVITSTGVVNAGTFLETRRVLQYTISSLGVPDPRISDLPSPTKNLTVGTPGSIANDGTTITLGGATSPGVSQSYGAIWYNGNNASGNCSAGACSFNLGLRAYFEFQFPNDKNSGDGFTFAIMSALTNTNDRVGGFSKGCFTNSCITKVPGYPDSYQRSDGKRTSVAGGELLGYAGAGNTRTMSIGAGEGLRPPKMAVEFDTYQNDSYSPYYLAGTRNDQTWSATYNDHMALMFWGDDLTNQNTAPLEYYDANGNDTNTSHIYPLSSFDDNRHGAGSPGRVNGLAAMGYFMEDGLTRSCRIEITRPTSAVSGGTYNGMYQYLISVWVEQTNALSAMTKSRLKDILTPFTDTSAKISQYAYFTQTEHNNFANIFWGFTQGTGDKVQQVPITNTVVFFPNTASACNYTISHSSAIYTSAGGSGSVTFTTPTSSCYWAVQSLTNWITITSARLYGQGNGTVSYAVEANTGPARIGYINIAGQSFQVSQDSGLPTCTLSTGAYIVPYNSTNSLTWSVTNNPTSASWTSSPGGTCGSPNPAGGSCNTATQTNAGARTYSLTVTNANGSGTCSTAFYVGCQGYRVWNWLGGLRDFYLNSGCRDNIFITAEITQTGNRLDPGETMQAYSSTGTCTTALGTALNYSDAMNVDIAANGGNGDCQVNFTGNHTATDH